MALVVVSINPLRCFLCTSISIHIYTCTLIYFSFTADYIDIMESLTFDGSVTSDQQCVNITILDDDENESPSIFGSSLEIFQVRLNISELNDAVQLGIQTAFVSIEDDDCKFQQKQVQVPIFFCLKY